MTTDMRLVRADLGTVEAASLETVCALCAAVAAHVSGAPPWLALGAAASVPVGGAEATFVTSASAPYRLYTAPHPRLPKGRLGQGIVAEWASRRVPDNSLVSGC